MRKYSFFIYILANKSGVLYLGVTNDLTKRLSEHQYKFNDKSFTAKYQINRLIYFEEFNDIRFAIAREKQIKNWNRKKKLDLIRTLNPTFKDLSGYQIPRLRSE